MPEHSTITDPNIHEPKGVAAASAGFIYVADGSGSGAWQQIDASSIDLSGVTSEVQDELDSGTMEVLGRTCVTSVIPDVSTASSILVPVPMDCTLTRARAVLGGTIAGTAVITFQNSSAAGMGTPLSFTDVGKGSGSTFTPSGSNTFTGPTWFEVLTDGGSTNTVPLYLTFEFEYILNQDI